MAEILWVNPVGSAAFDEETLQLIEAVRAPHHRPRVRHLPKGRLTSSITCTSTRPSPRCSS